MAFGAVEHDDFIAAGPAHHAGGISFAGTFNKNFRPGTDEFFVMAPGDFVHEAQKAFVALFFEGGRKLAGHVGGGSIAARGIFKNVGLVEFDFARERKGLLKVFFGLAGKTNDDVSADADAGFGAAQFFNDPQKSLAGVTAVHQFQQTIAAALDGEVGAFTEFRQARVGFDEVIAVTFGMRRGETNAFEAVDFVDGFKEVNEGGF